MPVRMLLTDGVRSEIEPILSSIKNKTFTWSLAVTT
jgi:hypothetical protein